MRFKNSEIYFSSDLHLFHKSICGGSTKWISDDKWPIPYKEWNDDKERLDFCKSNGLRDFIDSEIMTETIIERFNEKINKDDILFLLGDISFGDKDSIPYFFNKIKCKKINNHEYSNI